MPIDRISSESGKALAFHITDELEVYDEPSALALDHIFNHLKLLSSAATGTITQDERDVLAQFPRYEIDPEGDNDHVAHLLLDECAVLLLYLVRIAAARNEEQQRVLLAAMQDRVPFLNYRYPNDSFVLSLDRDHPKG